MLRGVKTGAGMPYLFEDFVLDPGLRELRRGTDAIRVEPQVFDLLHYLVAQRERAVTKEEILDAIWRNRIVSEATLNSRINAARAAIGDNGRDQRLIRTLRTKGFRFVGRVSESPKLPSIAACTDHERIPIGMADRPGIAVIPLVNMDGGLKRERTVDGLTEDLITTLARADWYSTASRNCSFAYKGKEIQARHVAETLGVRFIVQGSVRSLGGRQRICVQLVDALTDHNIWAERYDCENATNIQDKIIEKIAGAIETLVYQAEHLRTESKSPESLSAWQCMLRALSLMNTREKKLVGNARTLMERAATMQPQSARVHSLLSFITTLGVHQGWQPRHREIPCAQHVAQTALSLNSEDAWAYLASGYAKIWMHPEDAIPDLQKALSLQPGLAMGHYLLALAYAYAGQGKNAIKHGNISERLSPRDLLSRGNAGAHFNVRATACFSLGRYTEGMEFGRKAIAESPTMPTAYRAFLINASLAGELEQARLALQRLLRVAPSMSPIWIERNSVWSQRDAQKRYAEAFRIAGLGG